MTETAPHRILVVFDGSTLSGRAAHRAADLARERASEVTVLVVTPPRLWRGKRAQFEIPLESRDEAFARSLLAAAKEMFGALGVKASGRLRSGRPAEVIADEASRGFDLVVLGDRQNPSGAKTLGEIVRDQISCEILLLS